jgi:hypothetical protein
MHNFNFVLANPEIHLPSKGSLHKNITRLSKFYFEQFDIISGFWKSKKLHKSLVAIVSFRYLKRWPK